MMGKRALLTLAALMLMAAPALAEYPDDCLGLNEASGTDCSGLTDIGCCDDVDRVVWCQDGQLFCIDCAAGNPQCGWSPDAGFYDCGTADGPADPSGDNPKDCGFGCDPECTENQVCVFGECCTPDCANKACGDDGCGGSCGECGPGQACEDSTCEDLPACQLAALPIACDDVVEGTTVGATSVLDGYSCESWDESGPEIGYQFNVDYLPDGVTTDNVVVSIEYEGAGDLDIFALAGACTTMDCLDGHNNEVEVDVTAGGSYFFVVDGFGGAEGAFTMKVICLSTCVPVCKDGPCSDNGCKGLCPCEADGDVCYAGECCTPSCDGLECGDDGCGGNCGECEGELACVEGICSEATCAGSCGGSSPFGCFCDELCFEYGDCCEDICSACPDFTEQCGAICDPPCADGEICQDGECVECVPDCTDKECGSDGCGGSCGECAAGFGCAAGVCVESTGPAECLGPNEPSSDDCMGLTYEGCCDETGRVMWCDNGSLFCIDCVGGGNEFCGWQGDFYDCGTDGSEDPSGANPLDCGLTGGCDPACAPGEKCVGGECVACEPDCGGKSCGDDGCGGNCGSCPEGASCTDGACHGGPGCQVEEGPGCGGCNCEACVCEIDAYCCDTQYDDICVGLCISDCGGCPTDPVEGCGDGACAGGETCTTCPADCGCEAGFTCKDGTCEEATCEVDCTGKDCGDDGCGGSCGDCAEGEACVAGQCGACVPACDGKDCGDDGCGATCGACDAGFQCSEGICSAEIGVDVIAGDVPGNVDDDITTEEPKDEKSGCTTGATGNPFALMLFLSMLLAIVAIRRVNA